jgi:NADH-quinone oxidoreductase subunit N
VNREDFIALLPLIISAYVPVLILMAGAFWRNSTGIAVLSMGSLAGSFLSIFAALPFVPRTVTPLILVDRFSLFYMGLIFAGAFAVVLLSRDYLQARPERGDRFFALLLFAVFGMAAAASSNHFASFFLGLETLTVSLYGLIGFTTLRPPSLEGGIKYLVLAATSSAFLLFGIALVYSDFGTMEFIELSRKIQSLAGPLPASSLLGMAMIVVGFGFKLALVPFHMWSPDVYQGAPAPATALISSGSKGAIFALLFRFMAYIDLGRSNGLFLLLWTLAVLTMFGGNLLALLQRNLKRLLAYSSVAHMGYLLIPLLAGGAAGAAAFGFYLVSYFATVIAAFGVISVLSSRGEEIEELDDYRGLAYRQPLPAIVLTLAMLSLTGIPLTAGFIAKFYIFSAGIRSHLWLLVIIGIINSGISAFYYLRVLAAMYIQTDPSMARIASPRPWGVGGLVLLAAVLVFFGIYPTPLIQLAQAAMRQVIPFR